MPVNVDIEKIIELLAKRDARGIAKAITLVEDNLPGVDRLLASLNPKNIDACLVVGITGPPGVGKSTLTGELVALFRSQGKRVGVIAVDPSSPLSGGAILGDRIRMMEHSLDKDVLLRSMAARGKLGGICGSAGAAVRIMASSGCAVVIIETVGVGQSEVDIVQLADLTLMVTAPGMGDDVQAMKAGILEVADLIVINKADHPGADSAALDMEAVLKERGIANSFTKVHKTIASEGKGIAELVGQIQLLADSFLESGERHKRRLKAHDMEVFDWAMEMLKTVVEKEIADYSAEKRQDPRLKANGILSQIMKNE